MRELRARRKFDAKVSVTTSSPCSSNRNAAPNAASSNASLRSGVDMSLPISETRQSKYSAPT
jgi:hypothetical protein